MTQDDQNEMNELANEGWAQMKELLPLHGLVKKRGISWERIFSIAACLTILFIPGYLVLNHSKKQMVFKRSGLPLSSTEVSGEQIKDALVAYQKDKGNPQSKEVLNAGKSSRTFSQTSRNLNTVYIIKKEEKEKWPYISGNSENIKVPALRTGKIWPVPPEIHRDSLKIPQKNIAPHSLSKTKQATKIRFYAGTSSNFLLPKSNGGQNFSKIGVHPGIRVVLPFNRRISLHTGLYAMSALYGNPAMEKEKEVVNNLTAGVLYKVNSLNVLRASYFDFPLSLNYQITPRWYAGAGIQLSRLIKYKIKEREEVYDFNDQLTETFEASYMISRTLPSSVRGNVDVKKWEPRLILETGIEKRNLLFTLGYIQGPANGITIQHPNGNSEQFRNTYIKLGVQYRFK